VIRGIALLGVLQVNLLTEFRVSVFRQFVTRHTDAGWLNHLVDNALEIAVFFKAFALFSFLFGAGLGAQYERTLQSGRSFPAFAARRLAILLGIGLIHLFLINDGDILATYAVIGLLALPFMRCSRPVLLGLSTLACLAAVAPIPYPPLFGGGETLRAHIDAANHAYGSGSLAGVTRFRIHEVRHVAVLLLWAVPRTLSLFLLGVIAWRERLFEAPVDHLGTLRAIATWGMVGGGAAQTALFAAHEGWWHITGRTGIALDLFGVGALASGYAAALVLVLRRPRARRLFAPFASLGRAALSNYLGQSLILGGLFYGYGAGLYGRLGSASAAGLGLIIYALQVGASHMWFRHFHFGPAEWLWRSLTYGQRQPMRRRPS
jgi:uncharacterized protein